jgi:hypothetical protein
MISLIKIVVGVALLLLGRRLFWLFVGALGFIVAFSLVSEPLKNQPHIAALVAALVVGLIGALFAIFLQKVAVLVAGFLAGGYGVFLLVEHLGWQTSPFPWVPVLLGAIIGAVLVSMLFEWALILLSSLFGSYLIVHSISPGYVVSLVLFGILSLLGIIIQAHARRGGHSKKKSRPEP